MRQGGRGRATVGRRWPIVLLTLALLVPGTLQLVAQEHALDLLRAREARAAGTGQAPALNALPAAVPLTQQAPPSPSNADPVYPLSHTFDAEVRSVGSPPTNHDFETAGYAVGTPPTNYDFATGTLSGWTATTSVIETEAGGNAYARLNGSTLTSDLIRWIQGG